MRSVFLLSTIWLVCAACSPALLTDSATLVSAGKVECRKVARTGTRVSRQVCTTDARREQEQRQTQAALEEQRQRQRGRIRIDPNRLPSSRR